jgi:hypothetical protein
VSREAATRHLASRLRRALLEYEKLNRVPCPPDCPCPTSEALRGARRLISCLDRYDNGEMLMGADALSMDDEHGMPDDG